jgi:hypothetical protein
MRRSLIIHRRNAHEPRNFKPVIFAAASNKSVGLLRQNACLLWLGAGIDLNKKLWMAGGFLDLTGKRLGNFFAVDGLDGIEKGNSLALFDCNGPIR